MYLERVTAPGLAHYSYLIADEGRAVVIDPRRDVGVYLETAAERGLRITDIYETHRHEDFVVGSVELAEATGARIHHADGELDYAYGAAVEDGDILRFGRYELQALATPGHTPGSFSYLLRDVSGEPWIVFTGDTLFAGDLGRVDLPGVERMEEMAGLLWDSLRERLLPLGDHVIVAPAHGAGSVCGTAIAERPWTTIGLERRLNPSLRLDSKAAFIEAVAVEHERPPYFRMMEHYNLVGAPPVASATPAPQLDPAEFAARLDDCRLLDTRDAGAYAAAHPPGALSIWRDGLASFAGWLLPYDEPLLLVTRDTDPTPELILLRRLGYDDVAGCLAGGLPAWQMAGRPTESVETLTVQDLCGRLDEGRRPAILDVRSAAELESRGRIAGARHLHLTRLPEHVDGFAADDEPLIFCGSGLRSMVAASLLQRAGVRRPRVVLGGLSAWNSATCPVEL